jgi:tetratricopeptide (TPR) repeat protein
MVHRNMIALALCLPVLICCAVAQEAAPPPATEGVHPAAVPRPFAPPSPTATVEELEQRGNELREEKAYRDAIDYYLAALGKTSDRPVQASLYNRIGIAQLQLQHLREAQKNFDRALKKQKNLAEARNNLGVACYLEKKYSRAIDEYRKAIQLNDTEASFHNNLGTAYFASKQFDRAMAEYRRAIQLDPEVFHHTSRVGVAAQLSNVDDRALFAFLLARTYAQAGDIDRSLEYLRKAIEDGYPDIKNVYKDEEFSALRKDPRFTDLMAAKPKAIQEQ